MISSPLGPSKTSSLDPAACFPSLLLCAQNISHLPRPHYIMGVPLSRIPQTCLSPRFLLWMAPEHADELAQIWDSFLSLSLSSSYPSQPVLSWVLLILSQIPIWNPSASIHHPSCSHHQPSSGQQKQPPVLTLLPHEPTSNSSAPVILLIIN